MFCGVVVLLLIVFVRICCAQSTIDRLYSVPLQVEVLCVGSSHTGCTWRESPEFKNRVLWNTSRGLPFSLMRLRELERRNGLDGVRVCLVDCDIPSVSGLNFEAVRSQFVEELPISWRYLSAFSVSAVRLISESLLNCGTPFSFQGKVPEGDDDRPWLSHSAEERLAHLKRVHGDADTAGCPKSLPSDYGEQALEIVKELKRICDCHGIKLVLFASPQTTDNPARVSRERYAWAFDVVDRIKALGVTYYDWHDACPDDMFRDEGHLTQQGAYMFTENIFRELVASEHSPEF